MSKHRDRDAPSSGDSSRRHGTETPDDGDTNDSMS